MENKELIQLFTDVLQDYETFYNKVKGIRNINKYEKLADENNIDLGICNFVQNTYMIRVAILFKFNPTFSKYVPENKSYICNPIMFCYTIKKCNQSLRIRINVLHQIIKDLKEVE